MTASWRDIPADAVLRLLGVHGDRFTPRSIVSAQRLIADYGLPPELLPVSELVAGDTKNGMGVMLWNDCGHPVAAMQGVVVGDLIDAIAKGLGVPMPKDAPCGYSGSRWALAGAVTQHVRGDMA